MSYKLIQQMIAAGCTSEQISILVAGLDELTQEMREREEKQREQWRERQQRHRMSRRHHGDVTVTSRDSHKDLSSPLNGSPPSHYKDNTTPSPIISPSLIIDHFDAFWTTYPKKVGKGQAKRAWNAAVKKEEPATIISILKSYKWPDAEFIPHASTWLNGERWLDEQPKKEITFLSSPIKPQKRPVEPVEPEIGPEERERRRKQVDELLKGFGSLG